MRKVVLLVVVAALLAGCGGKEAVKPGSQIGKQTVVERSAVQAPEWILKPMTEEGEKLLFSGGVREVADYSLGLRQAKAEGIKNLAEAVQTKARTEFVANTQGSNLSKEDLGRFVQDGIAMVADNLEISGIMPKESYYEKVEEITNIGVRYFYNCYTLLVVPLGDYREARRRAIEGLLNKAKDEKNKAAEETATQLLDRLTK